MFFVAGKANVLEQLFSYYCQRYTLQLTRGLDEKTLMLEGFQFHVRKRRVVIAKVTWHEILVNERLLGAIKYISNIILLEFNFAAEGRCQGSALCLLFKPGSSEQPDASAVSLPQTAPPQLIEIEKEDTQQEGKISVKKRNLFPP